MKKRISNPLIIYTFSIMLLSVACEKETELETISGQLTGYVELLDGNENVMQDNSGVEVIIEGSNPQKKTLTDENGQFVIDDLKSGTYNIIFNKDGYCQHKVVSYPFIGGNKPSSSGQVFLYKKPNAQIDSLEITPYGSSYNAAFLVTAKISSLNENPLRYCRFYLSNKPDVSFRDYISTRMDYDFSGLKELNFYLRVNTSKFPRGSELYLIAYPASGLYQSYTDINSGKMIYSTINVNQPSGVVNITIPDVEEESW